MNRKESHLLIKWLPAFILLSALLACNISQAVTPTLPSGSGQNNPPTAISGQNNPPTAVSVETSTATAKPVQPTNTETPTNVPIVHKLTPAEPPAGSLSEITDRNTSAFATQKRTNGGDSYVTNLYERPFNANSMDTYFPDLDITRARLFQDSQWTYISIYVVGPNPAGGMPGDYGVEVDLNMDGRGDVLVMAANPGTAWSTDGVGAWLDKNHDVGSTHPIQSDPPATTDGYETQVFNSGVGADPDTAWARISPSDPNIVQIAFKSSLINDNDKFMWGAWTMNASMFNPGWFDYNDHFTNAEAGSPLVELTQYYPIKALAEVDNTCRWAVGFVPTGDEPGVCPVPATPTPEPTETPIPVATITGLVYHDFNRDGMFNGADYYYPGVSVEIRSGTCAAPGGVVATVTVMSTGWYIAKIMPGTFCVNVPVYPPDSNQGSGPVTVTVNPDGTRRADFRFWLIIY
ncbi:MAG: hypothetical protein ABSG01_14655 [Anaerolineales bacterium]